MLNTTTECPPLFELERLLRGRCTEARAAALSDHVGGCPGCQRQLDELAGAPEPELAEHLRSAEHDLPPKNSAYWRALADAEEELRRTSLFSTNGLAADTPYPDGDLKLDFLQPADKPGRLGKLAQFDVVRVVGRGGMGVVLHAFDPSLNRDVAIKVIDPQLANNEVARQRFCREARAAAAVTHDNLVAVHQVSEDEPSGLPYLVMQLINGESLEQRLKRAGKMTAGEVARLGMQAAAGLAAAHAGGLIHRDIKPANILLEAPADRVKLTDFGLARAAQDVKLTRTGFVAGSPLYMAPEQARGDEMDPRADLFSLGTVLYEAATGVAPFDAKTPLAVLRRVSDETQMPLARINPDVPHWLSDAVDLLLKKEPGERFQTAAEVAEVFAEGLREMGMLSPLDVPAEVCASSRSAVRARKPICWKAVAHRSYQWAGGAALGGLAVGLLWALLGGHGEPPPGPAGEAEFEPTARLLALDVAGGFHAVAADPGPAPDRLLRDEGASGAVWALGFLNNGELVAGTESGRVKRWDWRNSVPKFDYYDTEESGGTVWAVDLCPKCQFLAVASDDSTISVWNVQRNTLEFKLPSTTSNRSVAFSPDGRHLATGNRNSAVTLWGLADGIPMPLVKLPHKGTVYALAYSPDGAALASAGSDGKVRVWNLAGAGWQGGEVPRLDRLLTKHKGTVYAVAFSPDGSRLASAGWDGFVRLWNVADGTQELPIKAHDFDAWSVAFGNGGQWLASAGSDGFVKVWNVRTGEPVFSYRGPRAFHVVRFAPDGTTLAAGSRDGTVKVWELKRHVGDE